MRFRVSLLCLFLVPAALAEEPLQASPVEVEQCLACHTTIETGHSIHERELGKGAQAAFRCEACHGSGEAHASPVAGEKRPAPEFSFNREGSALRGNEQCLTCHAADLNHQWENSAHDLGALACNSCHGVHEANDPASAPDASLTSCGRCHDEQLEAGALVGHHPFLEQQVTCDGCHDPHGDLFTMDCKTCHGFSAESLAKQPPKARQFHTTVVGKSLNCSRCHEGVAHGAPDWVTEWQQAREAEK